VTEIDVDGRLATWMDAAGLGVIGKVVLDIG
jgi:hypothetical protein